MIKQINWNFANESKPIHLGTLETKAYTTNSTRTVYTCYSIVTVERISIYKLVNTKNDNESDPICIIEPAPPKKDICIKLTKIKFLVSDKNMGLCLYMLRWPKYKP